MQLSALPRFVAKGSSIHDQIKLYADNLTSPAVVRKNENGFSFVKHLSEMRWRPKEAHNNVMQPGSVVIQQQHYRSWQYSK